MRLIDMLRRRGATLPEPRDANALTAISRCAGCRTKDLCDAWLTQPDNKAPRTFCPNAGYVEYRRELSLRFS